ncbi:MAG TPA: type II toxin-antitoxin system VapC family toxin [Patescibacteria group bacterium]|nr:type II toxin-antitoxin system VapC family toxin [Patescibacteria group bacterium]
MSAISPTNIILDSSVIAKWFFPSEQDSEIALKIRDLFLSHELSISVPILIYYEINNLLRTATKRLRISKDLAKEAYQGFLDLELVAYSSKELMEMALEKAVLLDISSYDASYVVLAEYLQIPLISADQKLVDKTKTHFVQNLQNISSTIKL